MIQVDNPKLEAALNLVSQGYHVFPLVGKIPAIPKELGGRGHLDATQDRNQIVSWWKDHPEWNIGIACGPSKICVLDIDPRNDGVNSLGQLEAALGQHLSDITDCIVTTAGGGRHYYFRAPDNVELHHGANKLGRGVDVKADGGYVVAPGSDGYEFISGSRASKDLANLPESLTARLKTPPPPVTLPASGHKIYGGSRNDTLTSLAGTYRAKGSSDAEIFEKLKVDNQRCVPPLHEAELRNIARSIGSYAAGTLPARPSKTIDPICLADVESKPVKWLWEPYIPLETITLMEGDPGVGKSYLALEIAARISKGEHFEGDPRQQTPGNILYLTAEDSLEQTIRPRFEACGGDVSKLYSLRELVSLNDPDTIEQLLDKIQPTLVIIDPIQAYLGQGVDMHRANHVRPILAALGQLAEKYNCSFILLRHLAKAKTKAAYAGMGSIDFRAAARSVLLVAEDPQNSEQRVLIHSKYSLSKQAPSLLYTIDNAGKVQWNGISAVDEATIEQSQQPTQTPPDKCPQCGGALVIKVRRSDNHKFYGCSNFSNGCKVTVPYEDTNYL